MRYTFTMNDTIYLDYAAATPMDPQVLAAMQPYFSERFFNPSATYLAAQSVHKDLEAARAKVGFWLGARHNEIVFTAGTTEANNLVINGVMRQFPEATILVSAIEHESILAPAHQYNCREVPVTSAGLITVDALEKGIDDQTVLISVMYANNEVGTVQPLHHFGQLVAKVRADRRKRGVELPLYLHTDAAQAANYLDLHVSRLGVDFLTLNGGKMYGPKQCGVLYANSKVRLQPQILGGGQERGLRSGTENVASAIGVSVALDLVQAQRHDEVQRLQKLQNLFYNLLEQQIPNAVINGSKDVRLPNNVHITIPGEDNERLPMALDEAGIMCAAGSACSASNEEPSHVLRAMGISEADAQSSLRFSMGQNTSENAVQKTVQTLASLLQ